MRATPFQAWRPGRARQPRGHRRSFNGATPFQAWRLAGGEKTGWTAELLQWGHALPGVETRRSPTCSLPSWPSFNGATPFQAWRPPRECRRR